MKLPIDPEVRARVDRLELPWNSLHYDPYGVSKEHLAKVYTALGWFYRNYFRVRCFGASRVPPRGRVMLVGNHSGGVAIDGAMVIASAFFEFDPPRLAQGMVEKFMNRIPFTSQWQSRTGQFTGLPETAERLLRDERMLMVFPEGSRGTAKLFWERHSLVDFGTGFMRLAMKTHTPIVPVAVLGGGEALPTIANSYALGKLLGAPYIPIPAHILPIPLPAQMEVHYGDPLEFLGTGSEEDEVVTAHVDEVKRVIARMMRDRLRALGREPGRGAVVMRVMIPGISSPIARLVARDLLAQGHEVIGIDRRDWTDAPDGIEMHAVDIRKRAAEDIFRKRRPDAVVHMATVTHLVAATEERYRINLGGTRAVFEHSNNYGVEHVIFVGRHTYYGASSDQGIYHHEDDPPMAVSTFPELADLVASDLYACQSLWRFPTLATTVLRVVYALGSTGHGTLASFLRGKRVPVVMGFDPLFQFMHETDVASAICAALAQRARGVYNVAGPAPLPLSVIANEAGRSVIPLPEVAFQLMRGRFGLPRLPPGAVQHVKYPVVIDAAPFRESTGWKHRHSDVDCIRDFARAFPPPR